MGHSHHGQHGFAYMIARYAWQQLLSYGNCTAVFVSDKATFILLPFRISYYITISNNFYGGQTQGAARFCNALSHYFQFYSAHEICVRLKFVNASFYQEWNDQLNWQNIFSLYQTTCLLSNQHTFSSVAYNTLQTNTTFFTTVAAFSSNFLFRQCLFCRQDCSSKRLGGNKVNISKR